MTSRRCTLSENTLSEKTLTNLDLEKIDLEIDNYKTEKMLHEIDNLLEMSL